MDDLAKAGRPREILRSAAVALAVTIAALAALEILLCIADFRELREGVNERSLSYRHDAELGSFPAPNSSSVVTNARTFHVQHNSLGLRDIEFVPDARPTIMFLGDSFVWGLDAEADQRFSDLLRKRVPGHNIIAAGVSGFGTDQEYLLLQRLWPTIKPAVVVLIFCTQNDRQDNSTNIRYEGYQKPYFVTAADGSLVLRGQPVPKSRLQVIKEDWLVRHLWLGRLVSAVYLKVRHPLLSVPDPTERLVGTMRDFVQAAASFSSAFNTGIPNSFGICRPSESPLSALTAPVSIRAHPKARIGRPRATSMSPNAFSVCWPKTTSSRRGAFAGMMTPAGSAGKSARDALAGTARFSA